MTDTVVPIQPASFSSRGWKPFLDYRFAAGDAIIPISTEEISRVTVIFPLAFTAGDTPVPVAVMGLQPGQNLFVAGNGQWVATYVPAAFRGYPFKLLRVGEEQFALGYDEASGLLVDAGDGEPFFGPDNKPTERVNETLQFLVKVNRGQQVAGALAGKLAAAGVLEPWPLTIRNGEQEIPVNGLLRINEKALGELDDAAFLELRQSGALALAYAQLFSMANISGLARLAQLQADQAHAAKALLEQPGRDQSTIDIDAILRGRN